MWFYTYFWATVSSSVFPCFNSDLTTQVGNLHVASIIKGACELGEGALPGRNTSHFANTQEADKKYVMGRVSRQGRHILMGKHIHCVYIS